MNINSSPLVSIIIPTYNHAKFIGKALNSVKNQTYKNWEAIVIDNNSTDETNKILNNITDTRIKHIKIDNKGVIAKSRNIGINEANGEWIAFLDSDDFWTKDKLEICIKNINVNIDFIYHCLESVNDNKKFIFKKKKFVGRKLNKPILNDLLVSSIFKGTPIGNSSVFVRKKILNKIGGISENKKLITSEDFNTWLRIAEMTDNFKYINQKLGYFLIHEGSSQKNINLSIPHREAVIDFMHLLNKNDRLSFELKLKYFSGSFNANIKNKIQAKKDLIFVIKYGPIKSKLKSLLKIIILIIFN